MCVLYDAFSVEYVDWPNLAEQSTQAILSVMETNLTPEQADALRASDPNSLVMVDPSTNRRYVVVDADAFAGVEALLAIQNGISQMESGTGKPLSDVMNEIREQLERRRV